MNDTVAFVGNATQDTVFFVPHLPTPDEVSPARRKAKCLGGRGVVPSLVAGALGMQAELCTVIGADLRGTFAEFLHANGVGSAGVKWDSANSGTTQYVGFLTEDGTSSVAIAHRPPLNWSPEAAQLTLMQNAAAVYFSTNDLSFNTALIEALPAGTLMIHNLGVRVESHPRYLELALSKATIIIGNQVEVEYLRHVTGLSPHLMVQRGHVQAVIITGGSKGVQVVQRGVPPQHHAALPVREARSPVGAGDSFAVGVLHALVQGRGVEAGVRAGLKLAVLAVESERSYPDLQRVKGSPL
jgi:sugar/nucleoside kinase (ribokinase family)